MSTRIGLISDVHATPAPVQEALDIFARQGVADILCAGDIAGYGNDLERTVALLEANDCRSILGNHDLWWLDDREAGEPGSVASFFRQLPMLMELERDGVRIAMVHGSPPDSVLDGIRLLDENGEVVDELREFWDNVLQDFPADVLVVGHTHQVFAVHLGGTLVINPGSTRFNHTCAILNVPDLQVEFLSLGGRVPQRAWNWGMQYRRPG